MNSLCGVSWGAHAQVSMRFDCLNGKKIMDNSPSEYVTNNTTNSIQLYNAATEGKKLEISLLLWEV